MQCSFMYGYTPPQGFVRLGGHQLIQAGAAGEAVFKGHNIPGAADEADSPPPHW